MYGGDLMWKFEDEPALDDDTISAIKEMPKGPVVYKDGAVSEPVQEILHVENMFNYVEYNTCSYVMMELQDDECVEWTRS